MLSLTALYIFLIVLLLALGIIFLYVVIKRARRSPIPQEAGRDDAGGNAPAQIIFNTSSLGLKLSFSKAMRRIRAYGRGARYRIPWYLMIGEAHSGKTTLLGNTGMELLSDAPREQQTGVQQGLNWFFFDQGIVLDVAGELVLRADGATSNVKGWNYLAKLLRRYRPERPLDGIILTIPCTDLMGAARQSPEFKLKLEQKAQCLYNKLVDAQKRLGLSFPVYVLITKCDEVTGFKSLCHALPERRDEMFGWSSPYTREIAYRPAWVTEAFQNLHGYLFQLQIEVFAQRDRALNCDEFFMLPSEIGAMRAPLQIYLDQIFKESAYHEPFFLRGIYFCGDDASEAPASTIVLNPPEPEIHWRLPQPNSSQVIAATAVTLSPLPEKKHAFLEHLFKRKIFQEESLARPVNRTMLSRNRLVLTAQVLSLAIPLIGVLGILATYPALKEREATFYNYLTREEQNLEAIKAEKESGFLDDRSRNRESQTFEAMTNMGGKNLISPFIPGSWFSHVSEQSDNSISGAYQFTVYDSLRLRLDCRTMSKLAPVSSSETCYAAPDTDAGKVLNRCASESDYSSNSVHAFIESLDELIQNRARYDRLIKDDGGDLDDLNYLLRYVDHTPLPANFDLHNSLLTQALRTSQRPALRTTDQSVYDRAACKFQSMIQDIYDRTFKNHTVTYGYLGDITKTEALLSRPNYWLANRVFEPPSAFAGMTFADGVSEFKRALNDLSKEKFMSRDDGTPPPTSETEPKYNHQARSVLVWDQATLQQAIDLYKEYDTFVKSKSYNRLETLDNSVKEAARNDLKRKLDALVARAASRQLPQLMPGESARKASIRSEIKSFVDAQDLLSKLLDICRALGMMSLRNMVSNQTASLLSAINEEFYADSFYTTRLEDFSWWTSATAFHSYTAFETSNPDELEVYLATQREGIEELARQYAAPVLGFASAQNISLRSSVNWKEILDQLDKYNAKKPGNTVAVLENFIRFEMDKVKLDDCSAIVAGPSVQPLDYFIRVRDSLRKPFYLRCQVLAAAERARAAQSALDDEQLAREKKRDEFYQGLKSYTDIEDNFNQTLAGKFPFAELPGDEPFAEADPESIKAFFEVLAKNQSAAKIILQQAPNYNISSQEALDFLKQMEAVRGFFDAFLSKKQVNPTFDLTLRFRVNEEKEVGGNQVIDWNFNVGKKQFHYQDISPAGVWGYGEPLSLSLRWANDSPIIPASKFDPLSHLKLEGQNVTLTYSNNWSLLYFILKHKGTPADFKEGVDLQPYTLRIEVPTQPNAKLPDNLLRAQPQTLRLRPVEVFLRIGLIAPGKKDTQEPLILPDVFPTRAPQLDQP